MQLFLCEKPSQARDIAKVLGISGRGDGCLKGQGITVTWCIGHLLEAAPPETYNPDYKKWTLEQLPILPQQWKMCVKPKTSTQFKIVKKLLAQASELIIATDADREGEMIARELVDYCGYQGKISRLWLSALNETSIRQALSKLKAGSETLPMYYSALTRSRSDWLIGMNLSRLFTLLGQNSGYEGVLSVGRVQTPTLGLVVKRDREIANFIPKPYWAIDVMVNSGGTHFVATWQAPDDMADDVGRCVNEIIAKNALKKLQSGQIAQVISVETERVKEVQPLTFDLGTLQEVCSRKFGLGAQETLDIAQALYEKHKATTYPRSDCGYLPESMYSEVSIVLTALVKTDQSLSNVISKLDTSIRSRVWNDKKITAHHGIIPALEACNLAAMNDKELAVYQLVRAYYLAQFMPHHEYDRTVAELSCTNESLKAVGKQIAIEGWHSVLGKSSDGEEDKESKSQVLPKLTQGMSCAITNSQLKALKTLPPKYYTEGELIKTMKGIARFVTDPRLKQILKETTGIGTEATRAAIIKGLLDRNFLVTKNKSVHATDAAFTLIDAVPAAIIDPGMTALWEQALTSIENGQMSIDSFLAKQTMWIRQLVTQYSNMQLNVNPKETPTCPHCKASLKKIQGKNGAFWSCSNYPSCTYTQNIAKSTKRKRKTTPQK